MTTLRVFIDGRGHEALEGQTILELAREQGIDIPHLCYHPALKPVGACKVCAVEVFERESGPTTRLACLLRVKDGLSVRTSGELVTAARTKAWIELMRLAPQADRIIALAARYEVELPPPPDGCIRCRLCVRVCRDVVGPGALVMEKRGSLFYVTARDNLCIGCGTCGNLCPTGAIRVEDRDGFRTVSIRDQIIGRHVLTRCEMCGREFATERFLNRVDQRRTDHHPDVKEHHHYCPTCAKIFSPRVKAQAHLKMR